MNFLSLNEHTSVQAAAIIQAYNAGDENININALIVELSRQTKAVHDGDLKRTESMLIAQAHTLDALFGVFTRKAQANMGEYIDAFERYMRLALKTQTQCRATLETLAAIKNPPVIITRQANIAHGPQQVNNGAAPHACAGKCHFVQNELLEDKSHEVERLDIGTTGATVPSDPAMATVGEINGTTIDGR